MTIYIHTRDAEFYASSGKRVCAMRGICGDDFDLGVVVVVFFLFGRLCLTEIVIGIDCDSQFGCSLS